MGLNTLCWSGPRAHGGTNSRGQGRGVVSLLDADINHVPGIIVLSSLRQRVRHRGMASIYSIMQIPTSQYPAANIPIPMEIHNISDCRRVTHLLPAQSTYCSICIFIFWAPGFNIVTVSLGTDASLRGCELWTLRSMMYSWCVVPTHENADILGQMFSLPYSATYTFDLPWLGCLPHCRAASLAL